METMNHKIEEWVKIGETVKSSPIFKSGTYGRYSVMEFINKNGDKKYREILIGTCTEKNEEKCNNNMETMTFEIAKEIIAKKYGYQDCGQFPDIFKALKEAAELYANSLAASLATKAWEEGVTFGLMAHSTRTEGGITNFKNPYKK